MRSITIKKASLFQLFSFIQLFLLMIYLALNIKNVGEFGVALPLLAGFVALAGSLFVLQTFQSSLSIRIHFFVFMLLIAWISLRVIIDFSSVERLKAITIGTTGGMLLFFLIGIFTRRVLDVLTDSRSSVFFAKITVILFSLIGLYIYIYFKGRLLDRIDIFYIEGVDGGYQRPGNFLIILFMITSFSYLSVISNIKNKKIIDKFYWPIMYGAGLVLALVNSQMMGSNSATANLLAVYLITMVISLLASSNSIRQRFLKNRINLTPSFVTFKKLFKYSFLIIILFTGVALIPLQVTDFDLSKTRAFGFGSGENTSVNSRFNILFQTGAEQLSYAPVFGNMNVAYLTTGVAGRTLHNFIPNVGAELGLIGLLVVVALFYLTFKLLLRSIRKNIRDNHGFNLSILNLWLFFVLLFLFLYANLATGKSWPVMWFFIGFSVNVFVFNNKRVNH